jgi:CheY-like chemotaxis protein
MFVGSHLGEHVSPPVIFAVDDSEMDVELLRVSLTRAGVARSVEFFVDGDRVVKEFRHRLETFAALPFVCFLDIKMPGLSGLQVLEWIRQQPPLNAMAVVMVTSSNHPDDVAAARRLGAQCYLVKFPKPEALRAVITAAEAYAIEPDSRATFALPCNYLLTAPGTMP